MSFEDFAASVSGSNPPAVSPALLALWYDRHGDWDQAHTAAQENHGPAGSWVHAYLHRKEGDQGNAEYWYARARKKVPTESPEAEWEAICRELLGG